MTPFLNFINMYLFVGEKRSNRAIQLGVTFRDKALAGKQLYDALTFIGIDYDSCEFVNLFERGGKKVVKSTTDKPIVALGSKVAKWMEKNRIKHIQVIHPAARGTIRKKENYFNHIKEKLVA